MTTSAKTAATSTVFEVNEVLVEEPLIDGATAWSDRRGLFSTLERATEWIQTYVAEEAPQSGVALRYWVIDEIILDGRVSVARTRIVDAKVTVRGDISGDVERPWGGRAPESCRYQRGDLVGFVYANRYRIGVVLALPLSPAEALRLGPSASLGDDRYLIGLVGTEAPSDPDGDDHDHVSEPLLFAAPLNIDEELRGGLGRRVQRYVDRVAHDRSP